MINEMGVGDRRAPGIEKKALETIQQTLTPLRDYQDMKMQATMVDHHFYVVIFYYNNKINHFLGHKRVIFHG